jgi:hypothetical protein
MKRWPIIIASIAGAIVGFLCVVYVGMAFGLATSLTKTATVVLVVICPVMYSIWWKWWLVPVLNAVFYAGLAFGVAKWKMPR